MEVVIDNNGLLGGPEVTLGDCWGASNEGDNRAGECPGNEEILVILLPAADNPADEVYDSGLKLDAVEDTEPYLRNWVLGDLAAKLAATR